MKITVDYDRLYNIFNELSNLKKLFENNSVYSLANYITTELASLQLEDLYESKKGVDNREEPDDILITPEELMERVKEGQEVFSKKEALSSKVVLKEALEIVNNVRNHLTVYDPLWMGDQLQKVCYLLGALYNTETSEKAPETEKVVDSKRDKNIKDSNRSLEKLYAIVNEMRPRLTMQEIVMNEVLSALSGFCQNDVMSDKLALKRKVEHLIAELRR